MASSNREAEHRSASACKCEPSAVAISSEEVGGGGWSVASKEDDFASLGVPADKMASYASGETMQGDDDVGTKLVRCQMLSPGTSVRVPPMERTSGGWSREHFHERLRLPEGSPPGRGMVVLLEGMARECLAVALSPYHDYELGKTYVVHFGANGNMQTVLRRHVNYQECVDATFPSRVCDERSWVPYWIVLQGGKLSAGVGRTPGRNCVGTLDDSMYDMLRSGVDAVRYVGIGNSALQRSARDLRVRNVCVTGIPPHYGLGGIPVEAGGRMVNIVEMGFGRGRSGAGSGGAVMPTDAELLAEYERERAKAKARAAKFGIEYKEPAPDAFLKWSEARRLRMNPERGFITGIDTFSAEEKAKADARKERFAREERKRKGLDPDGNDDEGADEEGDEEAAEDDVDDAAEWEETKRDPLPAEQAWENWKFVQKFRVDPPKSLWTKKEGEGDVALSGPFSDDVWHGNGEGVNEGGKGEFIPKKVDVVPTKIHLFSIDWQCFKQIRTDDLMSYFRDYGPSYVEWLGELSCNVLFEDKHSAARAFHALSQDLPSPPPEGAGVRKQRDEVEISDNMREEMKDRWTKPETSEAAGVEEEMKDRWTKVEDAAEAEEEEVKDRWTKVEDAADDETKDDYAQGGGEDTAEKSSMDEGMKEEREVDAGNDAATEKQEEKPDEEKEPLPDYGGMGWRFCKWTVRKVSNDRYGRRGTRARLLMRLATTDDVLDDRPTEWPKPPPGFTTKRKLMPWYDFSGRRRHHHGRRDNKRRRGGGGGRRNDRDRRDDDYDDYAAGGGEHPGLSQGLRSGRSGFTMEEIQAERNAKNAEILT